MHILVHLQLRSELAKEAELRRITEEKRKVTEESENGLREALKAKEISMREALREAEVIGDAKFQECKEIDAHRYACQSYNTHTHVYT
jgi:hypothetical protein